MSLTAILGSNENCGVISRRPREYRSSVILPPKKLPRWIEKLPASRRWD